MISLTPTAKKDRSQVGQVNHNFRKLSFSKFSFSLKNMFDSEMEYLAVDIINKTLTNGYTKTRVPHPAIGIVREKIGQYVDLGLTYVPDLRGPPKTIGGVEYSCAIFHVYLNPKNCVDDYVHDLVYGLAEPGNEYYRGIIFAIGLKLAGDPKATVQVPSSFIPKLVEFFRGKTFEPTFEEIPGDEEMCKFTVDKKKRYDGNWHLEKGSIDTNKESLYIMSMTAEAALNGFALGYFIPETAKAMYSAFRGHHYFNAFLDDSKTPNLILCRNLKTRDMNKLGIEDPVLAHMVSGALDVLEWRLEKVGAACCRATMDMLPFIEKHFVPTFQVSHDDPDIMTAPMCWIYVVNHNFQHRAPIPTSASVSGPTPTTQEDSDCNELVKNLQSLIPPYSKLLNVRLNEIVPHIVDCLEKYGVYQENHGCAMVDALVTLFKDYNVRTEKRETTSFISISV